MLAALKSRIGAAEEWWFDRTRSVRTAGLLSPKHSSYLGNGADANIYLPARAVNVRHAIQRLPLRDDSQYTFVDIGSGKGRVLFIAAEYPFRKVCGIEFSDDLHRQAQDNIRNFRSFRRRCSSIESIHANAAEYSFPNENLVLYLFNPFGAETMTRMLRNLERSIQQHPRHVILLLLWPEQSSLIATHAPSMHPVEQNRRHHIYHSM